MQTRPNASTSSINVKAVQSWLTEKIAERLGMSVAEIDIRESFSHYGLGSLDAVTMIGELEDWLHIELSPVLLWEYPTIAQLSQYLAEEQNARS